MLVGEGGLPTDLTIVVGPALGVTCGIETGIIGIEEITHPEARCLTGEMIEMTKIDPNHQ